MDPAAPLGSAPCRSTELDPVEVLAAHRDRFGSSHAAAAAAPITLSGPVAIGARAGSRITTLGPSSWRTQVVAGGTATARGVDERGAWSYDALAGVVDRLRAAEAVTPTFEAWLLRRGYADAFDPRRDVASCDADRPGALRIAYARPELGNPALSFDRATAALVAARYSRADGRPVALDFERWSPPDGSGVRWPEGVAERVGEGPTSRWASVSVRAGAACERFERAHSRGGRSADATTVAETGASCLRPPVDRFALRLPADGAARVPMRILDNAIHFRARVGEREVDAELDSGSRSTALDATAPGAAELLAAIGAPASPGGAWIGPIEIPLLGVGELVAEHLPAVSIPIPSLEALGARRPALILGATFFAAAAVRVDFARSELTFARSASGLVAPGARWMPIEVLDGKPIASGVVEGVAAKLIVDTGDSGAIDLFEPWATAHGMPGARPAVNVRGRFGVGEGELALSVFRLAAASLGPVAVSDSLTHASDDRDRGVVAGLAGIGLFARCDAVVFDRGARRIALEGACDRPVAERSLGWRLAPRADPTHPDRPWVVILVWPGGAAERAGVRVGDRILALAGEPATPDPEPLLAADRGAVGGRVPVTVERDSASLDLTIERSELLRGSAAGR